MKLFYYKEGDWAQTEYVTPNSPLVPGPYYAMFNGDIYASDALINIVHKMRGGGIVPELNTDLLYEYFTFRYTAGEETLIKKIKRLPPGRILGVNEGGNGPFLGRYFNWPGAETVYNSGLDDAMVMMLEGKLTDRISYLGNYPQNQVAYMLSGGVDSSLLVALASGLNTIPIRTVSVVFDGFERDESQYSDQVVAQFGTRHRKILMGKNDFYDYYRRAVLANGEPISYPNTVPMLFMAQDAANRGGVRYLVNGEGADEIFGGYGFYKTPLGIYKSAYNSQEMVDGCTEGLACNIFWRIRHFGTNPFSGVNREIYYNMNTYLFPVVNRLVRMLDKSGIAPVSPFFDLDMLQFSLALPDRLKVNAGQTTKFLIKKLAEKYFDRDFVYRDKIGFSVPIDDWMRAPDGMGPMVDILREDRHLNRPYINRAGVEKVLKNFDKHEKKFPDPDAGMVWTLMNLEMWVRNFIEGDNEKVTA